MHGYVEAPWKELAEIERLDGRWYVTIAPGGVSVYYGAALYKKRLRLIFYEDIGMAKPFETIESAAHVRNLANDPEIDTITQFSRPRRVSELAKAGMEHRVTSGTGGSGTK